MNYSAVLVPYPSLVASELTRLVASEPKLLGMAIQWNPDRRGEYWRDGHGPGPGAVTGLRLTFYPSARGETARDEVIEVLMERFPPPWPWPWNETADSESKSNATVVHPTFKER